MTAPFPFRERYQAFADRESWLAGRRIGSSDIAKILGVSTLKGATPWSVWNRFHGVGRRSSATEDQVRGHTWERTTLIQYGEGSPSILEVRGLPTEHGLYLGPEDWATATPDAFALDHEAGWGLVEAKTDRHASWKWGEPGTIEQWTEDAAQRVRPDYALQAYHQMWVLDAPWVDLVVLGPFYDLRVFRLLRDHELEEQLVSTIRAWVERHIRNGEPPALDGSSDANRALSRLFRTPTQALRQATPAEIHWAREHAAARTMEDLAQRQKALMAQHLIASIGTGTGVRFDGCTVRVVRKSGRTTFDHKALRADFPDLAPILDRYTRTGEPSVHIRTFDTETT